MSSQRLRIDFICSLVSKRVVIVTWEMSNDIKLLHLLVEVLGHECEVRRLLQLEGAEAQLDHAIQVVQDRLCK